MEHRAGSIRPSGTLGRFVFESAQPSAPGSRTPRARDHPGRSAVDLVGSGRFLGVLGRALGPVSALGAAGRIRAAAGVTVTPGAAPGETVPAGGRGAGRTAATARVPSRGRAAASGERMNGRRRGYRRTRGRDLP